MKYYSTNTAVENKTVYRAKRKPTFNINRLLLWNSLNAFISGFLGGIAFSLGTIAFLSVNNKNVGSSIFTIGLIIIFAYGFGFYTSKIGYSLKNTKEQNIMLLPIWLGNLLGSLMVGGIMWLTRSKVSETLVSRANQLTDPKLSDSFGGIFILSVFCGLLMFIATDNYNNAKNAVQKYFTLLLTSMVFLLCEFEHFASSAFLFAMAGDLSIKAFWYLIVMTMGNTVGAFIIPVCHSGVKWVQNMARK